METKKINILRELLQDEDLVQEMVGRVDATQSRMEDAVTRTHGTETDEESDTGDDTEADVTELAARVAELETWQAGITTGENVIAEVSADDVSTEQITERVTSSEFVAKLVQRVSELEGKLAEQDRRLEKYRQVAEKSEADFIDEYEEQRPAQPKVRVGVRPRERATENGQASISDRAKDRVAAIRAKQGA